MGKLPATSKLLLQIFLLKEEGGKSWKETEGFLTKIVGKFQQNRLRYLTEKCVKEVKKLDADDASCLSSFLQKVVDVDNIGTYLTKAGFTRSSLLNCSFDIVDSTPTNGMLIELGRFQQKSKVSIDTLLSWFTKMTQVAAPLPQGTSSKLRSWINDLTKRMTKLQKNSNKDRSSLENFTSFMNCTFVPPELLHSPQAQPPASPSEPSLMPPQPQSHLQQKLGGMEGQLAALRREMELKEEHDKVLKEQVECLAEDRKK